MIRLSNTTKKLQAVLGGAITTSQPQAVVSFYDENNAGEKTRGADQETNLNSTTDVDICNALGTGKESYTRNIDTLTIYNRDTVSATVTVKIDDGGTESILVRRAIPPSGTLTYDHESGWNITGDPLGYGSGVLVNGKLDWSVSASALTVAVKDMAGNNPSNASPVFLNVRSVTADDGGFTQITLTGALSVTVPDTALLGTVNSQPFRLWAAIFNDGGTARLGVINCATISANAGSGYNVTGIYPLAGWGIASSTTVGTGSDSAAVFYTDAGVTSKAYATVGYATWESGLATAGTWSAGPTREQTWGAGVPLPGQTIQVQRTDTVTSATGTTTIPIDNTIPQNTEGDQYLSQAITPISSANVLDIKATAYLCSSVTNAMVAALFQDSTANALRSTIGEVNLTGTAHAQALSHLMLAATTSSTTFKVRAGGSNAGTTTFNGAGGSQAHGGVLNSYLRVSEVMT